MLSGDPKKDGGRFVSCGGGGVLIRKVGSHIFRIPIKAWRLASKSAIASDNTVNTSKLHHNLRNVQIFLRL